jgi:hypothetical protein
MKTTRIAYLLAATLTAGPALAHDQWVTVQQGNATVEIPQHFMQYATDTIIEDGKQVGIIFEFGEDDGSLLFYAVPRAVRPLARAGAVANDPTAEVTYEVDKDALGVVSGYYDARDVIFYSICKGRGEELRCFALTYPTARRDRFDPIVERLAASLR